MDDPYELAAALADAGKSDIAWRIIGKLLNENPMNPRALVMGACLMKNMGHSIQAYHFANAATRIVPHNASAWTNLGHAASLLSLTDEALGHYERGLKCVRTQAERISLWVNLSALCIDNGQFDKALHYINKILAVDPANQGANTNLGFCQLSQGNWSEGWKRYHGTIGTDWRKMVKYKDEPEWDGSPGKTVVLYADQGLGDEVLFASMVPDAAKRCKKLIIDCDGRLEGLFRRSFPMATVYGTRVKEQKWAPEDRDIDASLPIGQVGEFVRTSAESFPGTAYLKPCPDRLKQWQGLFASFKKPVIGIAWTGGVAHTNARNRKASLEEMLPLLELDAHFVSLQYKDASAEIEAFKALHPHIDLVQYSWATLTHDYDDTAAMVAALDAVVGVPTSVIHLAGAIGTQTFAMKAPASCWKYSAGLPFHPATLIEWEGSWTQTIERAAQLIRAHFGFSSATTHDSPSPTTFCSTPSSVTQAVRSVLPRSSSVSCLSNAEA